MSTGSPASRPLTGIRVLDFSHAAAAPFATGLSQGG